MAYIPYYTAHFTNEQSQLVEITISKKNGDPDMVITNYEVVSLQLSDRGEGQTKYDSTIIVRELDLMIWSTESDDITWETFITAQHDDWFILVEIDGMKYFEGWLTPDEGNAVFQDKPYEIKLVATNGLALLKDVPLLDAGGNKFDGKNSLIEYLAGALKQTGLSLPIRAYCRIYNSGMNDRALNLKWDMFTQSYLEYRTFLHDANTFVSCYDALKIILDKFCRLEYYDGMWLIKNIGEMQYLPHDPDYYTDYDADGQNPVGFEDHDNHAQIGKAVDVYPINEDQQINSRFAIKNAKTVYNYVVWPEIPKNNKFERGAIRSGSTGPVYELDANGDDTATQIGTYQDYEIDDWTFGSFAGNPAAIAALPTLSAAIDSTWRRSTSNSFGVETNREVMISKSTGITQILQSEGIPVGVGDKLRIDFDFKLSFNYGDNEVFNVAAVQVYIVPTSGGTKWWWRDGAGIINRWRQSSGASQAINVRYENDDDKSKLYKSINLTSQVIPVDGTLYIQLVNILEDTQVYFRNFNFEYLPFVAGGYIQVKGDYWNRSQNAVYLDTAYDELKISDSPKAALKGALLSSTGVLTTPNWYRYGVAENRHFKELINIARFNHSYRRMYALEGTFNGLTWSAENDQLVKKPIAFYKRYRMVDMVEPRDFVLVPPLKMDIVKGWITANLVEVRKDADGSADGTQAGDSAEFKYIF